MLVLFMAESWEIFVHFDNAQEHTLEIIRNKG